MPQKSEEQKKITENENVKSLTTKKGKKESISLKDEKTKTAKTSSKKENKSTEKPTKKTTKKEKTEKVPKTTKTKSKKEPKNTEIKKEKQSTKKKAFLSEYYDLPYRYNETTVKLLAQTPNTLFVYWDISDSDRENFIKQYGNDFFNTTRPVLIVHNITLNYSFEIEINDFANSWYIHIDDSKSKYNIELGRRNKIYNNTIPNNYAYVSSSNNMITPNDHILANYSTKFIKYRNVKTNAEYDKDISALYNPNLHEMYPIYELYKQLYKEENIKGLSNPSSHTFLHF